MVFPPKADETGTGTPRSAAPIHHAIFKVESPFANQQTFENRPKMRGTDKETFGGGCRILEVFLFFGNAAHFLKVPRKLILVGTSSDSRYSVSVQTGNRLQTAGEAILTPSSNFLNSQLLGANAELALLP